MRSLGVAGVALFAVVYNVPRYFESTLVWNATENVGNFARTALGSSTLYTVGSHKSSEPFKLLLSAVYTRLTAVTI